LLTYNLSILSNDAGFLIEPYLLGNALGEIQQKSDHYLPFRIKRDASKSRNKRQINDTVQVHQINFSKYLLNRHYGHGYWLKSHL